MTLEQAFNILHHFLQQKKYQQLTQFVSSYTDYYDFGYSPYDPKQKDGKKEKQRMAQAFAQTIIQAKHAKQGSENDLDIILNALRIIAHTNDVQLREINVKPIEHSKDAKGDKYQLLVPNAKTEAAFALGLIYQFYREEYHHAASYYLQAATAKHPIPVAERLLHSLPIKTGTTQQNLLVAYHYALYKPLRDKNFSKHHLADFIKNYGVQKALDLLLNDQLLNDDQKQQILLNTILHPNNFCNAKDFYNAIKDKKNSHGKLWIKILKTELFGYAKLRAEDLAKNLSEKDSTEKTKKDALLQFQTNTELVAERDEKGMPNEWTAPILTMLNKVAPLNASAKIFAGGWWKWNRLFDSPTGNRTGDFFKGLVSALNLLSEQGLDPEKVTNTTLKSYLRPG